MKVPFSSSDPFAVPDLGEVKARSARGTVSIASVQIIKFVLQFFSQIILARLLFPDAFGLVAIIAPVVGMVQVFNDVGLSQLLILRETLEQRFVETLFWLNLALGFATGFVIICIAPAAAWILGDQRLVALLIVTGLGMPLGSLGAVQAGLLVRQMRYGTTAVISLLSYFVSFVATAGAALIGLDYWSLIIGTFAASITSLSLTWYCSGWSPSSLHLEKDVVSSLKFGGNITGANLANYLTTAGDNLIVAYFFGSFALGLYDRSYRLVVQPIGQLLAPVSGTAVPLLSRLRDNDKEYEDTYKAMLQLLTLIVVPGMVVCVMLPGDVITVFLGKRWLSASQLFSWISVGGLFSGLYSSLMWVILSQGRVADLMRVTLACAVVNVLSFALGAHFGLNQIAMFGAVTFITINLPMMIRAATSSGAVRLLPLLGTLAGDYGVALLAMVAIYFLREYLTLSPLFSVAAGACVAYSMLACATIAISGQRRRILRTLSFAWTLRKRSGEALGAA